MEPAQMPLMIKQLSPMTKEFFSFCFKDVLMVSGLEIKETSDKEIKAKAEHADGEKCERCWKYETDLTEDHICHRCAEVLGK
jgi:isoleucyl-tRNA synthetase